jgi:hypothetical protein
MKCNKCGLKRYVEITGIKTEQNENVYYCRNKKENNKYCGWIQ